MSKIIAKPFLAQAVQAVERCRLITLCQRRIVEDGVHEVRHFPFQREDRLTNVQQLGGLFSVDMNAKQLQRFAVKK